MNFRKTPPDILTILDLKERPMDGEYDYAMTLGGILGTWHRLWSALSTQSSQMFGSDDKAIAMYEETVSTIRQEFEEKLGRAISETEFQKLTEDARQHGEAVKEHFKDRFGTANE